MVPQNTPNVERDSRSQEMRVVMDVCPRNEMSRCLCQDKSVAKFPFDMTTFFQTCKPDKVRNGIGHSQDQANSLELEIFDLLYT